MYYFNENISRYAVIYWVTAMNLQKDILKKFDFENVIQYL